MYKPLFKFINSFLHALVSIVFVCNITSCTTERKIKQEKVEVAILMPLTGPNSTQGNKLAQLVKYGLQDKLDAYITTTTYDVSTEDYARQAAEGIITNDTKIILGPLYSQSVKSLESVVKNHEITMLTLSNNPILADQGNIYVFGHAPFKQYHRMLSYLLSKGHTEFSILMPKTKSSNNLSAVLKEIITSGGGNVFLTEEYEKSEDSIKLSLEKISTALDSEIEEGDKIKPVILIAEENQDSIKIIFENLASNNLDNSAIIAGDNRLDIEYNGPVKFLFTGSNRVASSSFNEEVKERLNINRLNHLENAAYDLGAFTAVAIGKTYTKETFLNRLESPIWNLGLSGVFRFKDGAVERKYSIIERDEKNYKILHNE